MLTEVCGKDVYIGEFPDIQEQKKANMRTNARTVKKRYPYRLNRYAHLATLTMRTEKEMQRETPTMRSLHRTRSPMRVRSREATQTSTHVVRRLSALEWQ